MITEIQNQILGHYTKVMELKTTHDQAVDHLSANLKYDLNQKVHTFLSAQTGNASEHNEENI